MAKFTDPLVDERLHIGRPEPPRHQHEWAAFDTVVVNITDTTFRCFAVQECACGEVRLKEAKVDE